MNINTASEFTKTCNLTLNYGTAQALWRVQEWLIDDNMKNNPSGRCYAIVVNEIIKKIGQSNSRPGIRDLAGYQAGNGGSPSDRTTGIHYYIAKELMNNNEVSIWCMWCPRIEISMPTLRENTNINMPTSANAGDLEGSLLQEYRAIMNGELPEWNMQEGGRTRDWPILIRRIRQSLKPSVPYLEMPDNIDEACDLLKLYCWKHHQYNLFPN